MNCTSIRRRVATGSRGPEEVGGELQEHLRNCSDCRAFVLSMVVALGRVPGCPDGFDLAAFVAREQPAERLPEVAAHVSACPACSEAVEDMVSMRENSGLEAEVCQEGHGTEGSTGDAILGWQGMLGKKRDRLLGWLRDVVSEQFWVPVPRAVATVQGLEELGGAGGATAVDSLRLECRVFNDMGELLPDVTGSVVSPLTIDERGVLSGEFLLVAGEPVGDGMVSLVIDLHGRGGLRMGPEPVVWKDELGGGSIRFRATGFDRSPTLIPTNEYCRVVEN